MLSPFFTPSGGFLLALKPMCGLGIVLQDESQEDEQDDAEEDVADGEEDKEEDKEEEKEEDKEEDQKAPETEPGELTDTVATHQNI